MARKTTSKKVARLGSKAMRVPETLSDDEVKSLGASVVSQVEASSDGIVETVPRRDQSHRSRFRLTSA